MKIQRWSYPVLAAVGVTLGVMILLALPSVSLAQALCIRCGTEFLCSSKLVSMIEKSNADIEYLGQAAQCKRLSDNSLRSDRAEVINRLTVFPTKTLSVIDPTGAEKKKISIEVFEKSTIEAAIKKLTLGLEPDEQNALLKSLVLDVSSTADATNGGKAFEEKVAAAQKLAGQKRITRERDGGGRDPAVSKVLAQQRSSVRDPANKPTVSRNKSPEKDEAPEKPAPPFIVEGGQGGPGGSATSSVAVKLPDVNVTVNNAPAGTTVTTTTGPSGSGSGLSLPATVPKSPPGDTSGGANQGLPYNEPEGSSTDTGGGSTNNPPPSGGSGGYPSGGGGGDYSGGSGTGPAPGPAPAPAPGQGPNSGDGGAPNPQPIPVPIPNFPNPKPNPPSEPPKSPLIRWCQKNRPDLKEKIAKETVLTRGGKYIGLCSEAFEKFISDWCVSLQEAQGKEGLNQCTTSPTFDSKEFSSLKTCFARLKDFKSSFGDQAGNFLKANTKGKEILKKMDMGPLPEKQMSKVQDYSSKSENNWIYIKQQANEKCVKIPGANDDEKRKALFSKIKKITRKVKDKKTGKSKDVTTYVFWPDLDEELKVFEEIKDNVPRDPSPKGTNKAGQ